MAVTALVFVLTWLGALLILKAFSGGFTQPTLQDVKSRVIGVTQPAADSGPGRPKPVLIQSDASERSGLALRILQQLKLTEHLKLYIEQSGLKWSLGHAAHLCLGMCLAGFLTSRLFLPASLAVSGMAGLSAGVLPALHLHRKRAARLRAFEEQFPEALEFLARSMRSGHAFSVSIELLHREFADPLGGEFRRTFDEQNLGLPLEAALAKLSSRLPLMDLQFFTSAVLLQKRTGGNLAEIMDKLAGLIRERFQLRGRIRAVSAHGRLTGLVLTLIPLVVAILMFFLNRSYLRFFLEDETGPPMLVAAVSLQIIGYGVIRKIVSIDV